MGYISLAMMGNFSRRLLATWLNLISISLVQPRLPYSRQVSKSKQSTSISLPHPRASQLTNSSNSTSHSFLIWQWGTSPLSGSNDGVVLSSRLCDYSGGLGWSGSLGDSIGSILLHYRFQSLKSISLPPPWLALQGRINRKAWAPRAVCAVSVGEGSKWL